jgi:hypothetical protein
MPNNVETVLPVKVDSRKSDASGSPVRETLLSYTELFTAMSAINYRQLNEIAEDILQKIVILRCILAFYYTTG